MGRKIKTPVGALPGFDLIPTDEFLGGITSLMQPTVPILQRGMQYDHQWKYLTWDFNGTEDEFLPQLEIMHITDVQFGHKYCNIDRMIEYRDWILAEPQRYMVWGGDMVDAWAMHSPGLPWDQVAAPDSQVYRFCQTWAPARHRILGYVGGNHERRALKGFGDLGRLIAMMLGIPYSAGKQFVDIRFGNHDPFKICLFHGNGSAQTKGAIANVVYKFMMQGDSQLYLVGHLHQPVIIPEWREVRDQEHQKVRLEKIVGAMSSSFLETYGTYAETAGLRPGDVMMARAVLELNGKWEVTLR